jgi:hypothetical protein
MASVYLSHLLSREHKKPGAWEGIHRVRRWTKRGLSVPDLSRGCEAAELFVVHQFRDGRVLTADRALRITPNTYFAETHGQRIVHQQAADEGFAFANDKFDGFRSLNHANDPG